MRRFPSAAIQRALRFTADSYEVALPGAARADDGGDRDESQRRLVGHSFLS
jgi:hypothetical protein